jgi:prefoldin subunit 5
MVKTSNNAEDKNLRTLEAELRFILRHLQTIEGNFETVDELSMSAHSALRAVEEIKLAQQPACEEMPEGVAYPAAA